MAQKISEIMEALPSWEFLQQLPQEIDGFQLQQGTGLQGQILNLAAYVNEAMHCRLDLTYTTETFDYIPVKTIGLHTFRDERYFSRDREKFAANMLQHLPELIALVDRNHPHEMGWEARSAGFPTWEGWKRLPKQIGNYQLFITPDNPVEYLNGSMLFLDYTDFATGDQIVWMYNAFRDEIFAEFKCKYFPLTTDEFNAKNLDELDILLEEKLEKNLLNLSQKSC